MNDPDTSRWLEPSLSIHLYWNTLLAQDIDLDCTALRDPVLLQVDET